MPYLDQSIKDALDSGLIKASEPGHLTYRLYRICLHYLDLKGKRFYVFAEIMGALLCTILELYRRKVAPYEQEKIRDNGDVG